MDWLKRNLLGLTPPPPSQQSNDADNNMDIESDNENEMDNEEQSALGNIAVSFEAMDDSNNNNYNSYDDSRDGGRQHLEFLTQPRYEDDNGDDSSALKESSSVDIENYNQSDDNDDESILKRRGEQQKRSARRGGRAKRQTGDLLSKLPATPQSLASLPAAATVESPLATSSSPLAAKYNRCKSSSLSVTTTTAASPLKSPRNTKIQNQVHDTNNSFANNNDATYTTNNYNDETATIQPPPPQQKEHPLLHQLTMKQKAIDRSILHLSDNSYSFVYDEATTTPNNTANNNNNNNNNNTTKDSATKSSDIAKRSQDFISWSPGATTKEKITTTTTTESKEQSTNNDGLPFIGPGLKDQHETLHKLLQDGLLGTYNDEGKDNNVGIKPKIQSNVSAILMGPRGHGKSLLLERCLAELSRMAGQRKDRMLQQIIQQQQQQKSNGGGANSDDNINNQLSKVGELFTQASFRVVRINGLLYQGDNAVACTREIARQINSMSRTEKKKGGIGGSSSRRKKGETPVKKSSKRQKRTNGNHHVQLLTPSKLSPTKLLSLTKPASSPMSPKSPVPNNESHQFRLRRSGFNTNISLLDEALRTARIDGIPILIVLEELDTFLAGGKSYNMTSGTEQLSHQEQGGSNDRQLLLYHLLDRVADHKFLVSLVGMTTNLSTINQLEKRVQSRAEGTSKVIYFGHDVNGGYDACVKSLLGKFYSPPMLLLSTNKEVDDSDTREEESTEQMEMMNLRNEVEAIFRGNSNRAESAEEEETASDDQEINDISLVQRALKRNYEMNMDIRWFCGLLDIALSLLMSDIDDQKLHCCSSNKTTTTDDNARVPKLSPSHIAHALVMMGASLDDIASNVGRPGISNQNAFEQIRWGQLVGDSNHYSALVGTNPRLVALLDLSGPQIAMLLAARRIMARDDVRSTVDDEAAAGGGKNNNKNGSKNVTALSLVAPLTYKRIEDEYTTSFVNSERYTISSDRYPPHVLYRSFMDLMEMDLIRLKKEHCEGGALQYEHLGSLSTGTNISNLPLYVNLEWELDFLGVLKAGLLKCSTSLREWGLKIMN